jgi:hypothetical protein
MVVSENVVYPLYEPLKAKVCYGQILIVASLSLM